MHFHLYIEPLHLLAAVLNHQKIGNDGIGDQETLGGQSPAAVFTARCMTEGTALFQSLFDGIEGQQILTLM